MLVALPPGHRLEYCPPEFEKETVRTWAVVVWIHQTFWWKSARLQSTYLLVALQATTKAPSMSCGSQRCTKIWQWILKISGRAGTSFTSSDGAKELMIHIFPQPIAFHSILAVAMVEAVRNAGCARVVTSCTSLGVFRETYEVNSSPPGYACMTSELPVKQKSGKETKEWVVVCVDLLHELAYKTHQSQ